MSANAKVQAVAICAGCNLSSTAVATYTIVPVAPTISPSGGTFSTPQTVTITAAPGTLIYYTTDGNPPNASSNQYTVPIQISVNTTLKAVATAPGLGLSAPASKSFTILTPSPSFSQPGGSYSGAQSVGLTTACRSELLLHHGWGHSSTVMSTPYTGFYP